MIRIGAALVALALPGAADALAQAGDLTADSLLATGRLAAAESAYFAAVRARPRDPETRARLGRFLAARGATRVGTVLIEEARFFGGDSTGLARALLPLYVRLGDYKAVVGVEPDLLTTEERRRAQWLADHPQRFALRDSNVRFNYRVARTGVGFGTVLVRVGGAEFAAIIDPRVSGLVLPESHRSDLKMFGDSTSMLGVATMRIGRQTLENLAATIVPAGEAARVGFDVLTAFSPTFDPASGTITLHRPDPRWRPPAGTRMPALFAEDGVRLLFGGAWLPSSASNVALLLASRRWTWDARRGDVVLLTP